MISIKNIQKPQLVCPAGDWASVRAAVSAGADAVYFGIQGVNMRAHAENFDISQINKVMDFLRQNKVKGYLALNVIIKNEELKKISAILVQAAKAKVDAVILWDMAVLALAKKQGLRVHLSTQASVANIEAVQFYSDLGAERIVLARECTLKDIASIVLDIKKKKINCEIETFIHGAMCVSISGRCFLSEYSFDKSANRGQCLQPCRREFRIQDVDGETDYVLGQDYVLSPKDLCTIDFIDQLILSGVHAFKIEGRMRSPEYIGTVVRVYRQAIDAFFEQRLTPSLKAQLKAELNKVYHRGFSSGFYFGTPTKADMSQGLGHTHEKIYIGVVKKFYVKIQVADIRIQSEGLRQGDTILFIGPSTPALKTIVTQMQCDHHPVDQVVKGTAVGVKIPFNVRPQDKVFLWREKPATASFSSS